MLHFDFQKGRQLEDAALPTHYLLLPRVSTLFTAVPSKSAFGFRILLFLSCPLKLKKKMKDLEN